MPQPVHYSQGPPSHSVACLDSRYGSLEEVEVEAEHARSVHNIREVELLAHLKQDITKQVIAESRHVRINPLSFRGDAHRLLSIGSASDPRCIRCRSYGCASLSEPVCLVRKLLSHMVHFSPVLIHSRVTCEALQVWRTECYTSAPYSGIISITSTR